MNNCMTTMKERFFGICSILCTFLTSYLIFMEYIKDKVYLLLLEYCKATLMLLDIFNQMFFSQPSNEPNDLEFLYEIKHDYEKKTQIILKVRNGNPNDEERQTLLDIGQAYNNYIRTIHLNIIKNEFHLIFLLNLIIFFLFL